MASMAVKIIAILVLVIFATVVAKKQGTKVTFSNATSIDFESFRYSTDPEPVAGTQDYYASLTWVSVTQNGYEYEGSLSDAMSYLEDDEDMEADLSEHDPEPTSEQEMNEADLFENLAHQEEELNDPSETPLKEERFDPSETPSKVEMYDPSETPSEEEMYHDPSETPAREEMYDPSETPSEEEMYDPSETPNKYLENDQVKALSRMKRRIFYRDNRRRVTHFRYPYTAMGKIDIGCTGTFIARRTVLTAAHCIHSGGRRGRWYRHLNIGRCKHCNPNRGWRHTWKRAVIFRGWITKRWKRYDVGIILFHQPSPAYMYLKRSNRVSSGWVNMAGYPHEKWGCLYRTYCYMRAKTRYKLLRYRCDTTRGMSGSAVYKYWRPNRRIIQGIHAYSGYYKNIGIHIRKWHSKHIRSWMRYWHGY